MAVTAWIIGSAEVVTIVFRSVRLNRTVRRTACRDRSRPVPGHTL